MSFSQSENPAKKQRLKITVASTFTAEPLSPVLALVLEKCGLPAAVEFAPYQQVFQELTHPDSALARNQNGVNLLLVRPEDFTRFHTGSAEQKIAAQTAVWLEMRDLVQTFAQRSSAPLILALAPSTTVPAINALEAFPPLAPQPGFLLLTPADLLGAQSPASIADPVTDASGHIPYTADFFLSLALTLGRRIYALKAPPHKVIAVDADETLWSGVCGESGPTGVQLDKARRHLQAFLRARRDEGFLLCLCSKNAEADIRETFAAHPDWPLQFGDFTAHRINWQSKSANLRELAAELNLAADSFIFLDDNPLECAEVRNAAPEVTVLELPHSTGDIAAFLAAAWVFDRPLVTGEDRQRADFYTVEHHRDAVRAQATGFADFIAHLELRIAIEPLSSEQFERAAQLTQRTNQFNFTLFRATAAELHHRQQTGAQFAGVTVRDRFGDYGLVGLLGFSIQPGELLVEQFLLSCRVLGRGVEHAMMRHLLAATKASDGHRVRVPFVEGPRNQPARQFLEKVAEATDDGYFQLASTAECRWAESSSLSPAQTSAPASAPSATAKPDWTALAYLFSCPAKIRAALEANATKERPDLARSFVAPGTEMERRLAALLSEVLHLTPVGAHDNFFELGGQSLQLVTVHRLLLELGHRDLPIAALFEHPTVADLAAHLTLRTHTSPAALSGRDRGARQRLALALRK